MICPGCFYTGPVEFTIGAADLEEVGRGGAVAFFGEVEGRREGGEGTVDAIFVGLGGFFGREVFGLFVLVGRGRLGRVVSA